MDQALSYASGPTDSPLLTETIGANFARTVAAGPDRAALVDRAAGTAYTYRELAEAVEAFALGLLARGIRPGDRVGIWSPNRAEWVLTQFATARIGAVLVTVNPAYRTHELEYVLRQSGIRLLVSAPVFKTSDYRAMVAEVRDACPALEQVVFLDGPDWDGVVAAGRAFDPARLAEVAATLPPGRPDQHPVHLGHHRLPEGRDAHPPP